MTGISLLSTHPKGLCGRDVGTRKPAASLELLTMIYITCSPPTKELEICHVLFSVSDPNDHKRI
jgi:hypothetical protein